MLTQCPACHVRAQLSDSRSGAKVRCGECGCAYLAVPAGGREGRRGSRSHTAKIIVVVAAALVGAVALPLLKHTIGWGAPAEAAAGDETRPPVEAGASTDSPASTEPAAGLPAKGGG